MSEKILCVDDEPNILQGYQRALRKDFELDVALSGAEALEAVESRGPYAVVVSDMRMPGMDGVEFLSKLKAVAADTVRIMLTGNADQQTAIEAVNQGSIFRFLTKPCLPEALSKVLVAGLHQYRLVRAEKELLQNTLMGSIQVLTDVLALVNPTAFGRASRVKARVTQMVTVLQVENRWQTEIAALLSQVGCITIPEEILLKVYVGAQLRPDEVRMLQGHAGVGHDLIKRIPRLEPVAEIIAYQEKRFDGGGLPGDDRRGEGIPLGARILKVALDFDKLVEAKISAFEAYQEIQRRGEWYDPVIVEALKVVLDSEIKHEPRSVRVSDLIPGMIIAEDIISTMGLLLVTNGQEATESLCARLGNFARRGAVKEPIKVLIPTRKDAMPDAGSITPGAVQVAA